MAEWSGFFDAHKLGDSWDRVYLAEDFAKFFAPLIGNGVFAGKSNELQVFQNVPASMSVVLSSGQSWIDGYGYANDSDLEIRVDPADGALGRIDRIVNQWSATDRQIRTIWKKGTPAVNPVPPLLLWNADYKELSLCTLDISAGLSAISQDKIRDTRSDSTVCGWVTGLIDQVDTSTLFAQWESAYEKEFTEQKAAWDQFFSDIQVDLGVPIPSPDKAGYALFVSPSGKYTLSNEVHNHINDHTNPHDVTASQVGARPNTWLPTPEEIGAALTGYGLGTGGVYPSSLGLTGCAIARGGFYRWDTKTEDAPFANGAMLVLPRNKDSAAFQIACCASGADKGTIAVRVYSASAASEWEYINPPMVTGTEYRTTKRVAGNVVYTKRFSFGTLPKETSRRVQIPGYTNAYSMQNIKFIAKSNTADNSMQLAYGADPGFFVEETSPGVINVVVNTNGDFSGYTGYVTIEYTK